MTGFFCFVTEFLLGRVDLEIDNWVDFQSQINGLSTVPVLPNLFLPLLRLLVLVSQRVLRVFYAPTNFFFARSS